MLPYHTLVGDGAERWMLVLHGIYGSGGNWRSFARALTEARPEWGCALVDLRMHGRSQDASPPHTVDAAAADLHQLAGAMAVEGRTVRAVAGHSFGGKVTLAYAGEHGADLERCFVFDSSPAPRAGAMDEAGNTVVDVLRMMEAFPPRFDSRDAFVAHVRGAGYPPMLANWLAMNLEPEGDAFRFGLDPAAMRALLVDYYDRDAWPVVTEAPCPLHFIAAGKGDTVGDDARARLRELASDRVTLDVIADAGHWLHVDAPDALLELVTARL